MNTQSLKIAVAVTLVTFANLGTAADSNHLLDSCRQLERYMNDNKATTEHYKATYCLGLVEGARTAMLLLESQDDRKPSACIPMSVSNAQVVRVVLKYLDANPENLHHDATASVLLSLISAYPCTESKGKP